MLIVGLVTHLYSLAKGDLSMFYGVCVCVCVEINEWGNSRWSLGLTFTRGNMYARGGMLTPRIEGRGSFRKNS